MTVLRRPGGHRQPEQRGLRDVGFPVQALQPCRVTGRAFQVHDDRPLVERGRLCKLFRAWHQTGSDLHGKPPNGQAQYRVSLGTNSSLSYPRTTQENSVLPIAYSGCFGYSWLPAWSTANEFGCTEGRGTGRRPLFTLGRGLLPLARRMRQQCRPRRGAGAADGGALPMVSRGGRPAARPVPHMRGRGG